MSQRLVRFTRRTGSGNQGQDKGSSWYCASDFPVLHYREALDTDAVLRVVAQHHNKPANWTRGEQVPFKITGVNVIWRDVSSLQAETSLMNMDAAGLRKVLKLIEQRGWKDYIHVEYEENK